MSNCRKPLYSSDGAQLSSSADNPPAAPSHHSESHSHSITQAKPFHHCRRDHEACLRRLHGSPLPDGQLQAGDTLDGYGVKQFENGMLYAGDFEQGLRSGYGVQRWPDGHVYIGMWKQGKRELEGEYRFSYGDADGSGVIEDGECDVYKARQPLSFACSKHD